jgi:sugar lactone lactonase YvrE
MPLVSLRSLLSCVVACALYAELLLLGGCGGGGGGSAPTPAPAAAAFTVGGTLSGLTGAVPVKLALNGGAPLPLGATGSFMFATALPSGSNYAVTIDTQPAGQTCTITNGSGVLAANVTGVTVACAANAPVVTLATISGTIAGMTPGATLLLANRDSAPVAYAGSGSFTFNNVQGAAYALAVVRHPAGQWCVVTGGAGIATASTTPVMVTCRAAQLVMLAGLGGGPGSSDGIGTNTRFNRPMGMVFDRAGNLFIADKNNNVIRKITPAAVVTTFAGTAGSAASVDGTGAAARFSFPVGIAIDASDNLYVTDSVSNDLRKISPAGVVTTLADEVAITGAPDLASTATRLHRLDGIAIDGAGNQYVADNSYHIIRKRTPGGVITTFAGRAGVCGADDGAPDAALLCGPSGLAFDANGNLFVIDGATQRVRRISPAGMVSTLAGTGEFGGRDGPGTTALFGFANEKLSTDWQTVLSGIVAEPSGSVLVADYYNGRVRRIAADGTVTTAAGVGEGYVDGPSASARFRYPTGIAISTGGDIFVAEDTHTIRRIVAGTVSTFAGRPIIDDMANGQGAAAQFRRPAGTAVDAAGNIFVADFNNNVIRKVTPAGLTTTFAGVARTIGTVDGKGAEARFSNPNGIAIDKAGNLYVTDRSNIRKITPDAVVTTLAGAPYDTGYEDGVGSAARFSFPDAIAVDGNGNVYVADSFNYALRKVAPDGTVSTLARSGCGYADGLKGQFCTPAGVAVDHAGNVYFSDAHNGNIRKLTPEGVMSTVAGSTARNGESGSVDGFGAAARFSLAGTIALDSAGNIYVADTGNHTVRVVTPAGAVSTLVGVAGQYEVHEGPLPARLAGAITVSIGPGDRLYISSANAILKVE